MPVGEVDVGPLRERFLELMANGTSASSIARRAGWGMGPSANRPGSPDVHRLKRTLGVVPYWPGRGKPKRYRAKITYDNAVTLAAALYMDPHEAGL